MSLEALYQSYQNAAPDKKPEASLAFFYQLARDEIGRDKFLATLKKTQFLAAEIEQRSLKMAKNLKSHGDWSRFKTLDYLPIFSHVGKEYLDLKNGFFSDLEPDDDEILSPRFVNKRV